MSRQVVLTTRQGLELVGVLIRSRTVNRVQHANEEGQSLLEEGERLIV